MTEENNVQPENHSEQIEQGDLEKLIESFEFKKRAVLRSLSQGSKVSPACIAAGIGRTTFYDWLDNDPKFARAVRLMEEVATDIIEDAAWLYAQAGNARLIEFWLTNRRKDRWKKSQSLEMTGKDGGPIETKEVLDEGRIDKIVAILDGARTRGDRPPSDPA